ncbi:MAG: molybdopterin converting factor subunit 1 [Verrucomicrobiota bacterium]
MTILYFAHARRITGCAEETIAAAAPFTVDQLWAELLSRHPGLSALRASCRLACNQQFAAADTMIQPADEVAVIPPVSGG